MTQNTGGRYTTGTLAVSLSSRVLNCMDPESRTQVFVGKKATVIKLKFVAKTRPPKQKGKVKGPGEPKAETDRKIDQEKNKNERRSIRANQKLKTHSPFARKASLWVRREPARLATRCAKNKKRLSTLVQRRRTAVL